ncbi:hypothetical protein ElyMa_002569900 [Elysia marginata]|uniref:Uncharacterized protein n=1 Tax=Elysia marginata TaxID=1093978 RepID=A0AAV4GZL4_9GAST|nr:hypothetical protein ElyMa_002569900 [Elysia marginata]
MFLLLGVLLISRSVVWAELTPPEMTCEFPDANLRALYTGRVSNGTPKIKIAGKDAILGSATGVNYIKTSKSITRNNVIECQVFTYDPHQPNHRDKIKHLQFYNVTDCKLWFQFPSSAACKTLRRLLDELKKDDDRLALPNDCRLKPVNNGKSTYRNNNRGYDASKKYLHAGYGTYKSARFYLSEKREQTMIHIDGMHHKRIDDENPHHFKRGFAISDNSILVFEPFDFEELCEHSVNKQVDLKISRYYDKEIPMYRFSPTTPMLSHQFIFHIPESNFLALKTVQTHPCHTTDAGYRILTQNVLSVNMTKLPMSTTKEEFECHTHPGNWYSHIIMNSTTPNTTKAINLPHRIIQDYKSHKQHLFSNDAYCISFPTAVEIWVRPDATLKSIEYAIGNEVIFSNTYTQARPKVPSQNHCLVSGPACRGDGCWKQDVSPKSEQKNNNSGGSKVNGGGGGKKKTKKNSGNSISSMGLTTAQPVVASCMVLIICFFFSSF